MTQPRAPRSRIRSASRCNAAPAHGHSAGSRWPAAGSRGLRALRRFAMQPPWLDHGNGDPAPARLDATVSRYCSPLVTGRRIVPARPIGIFAGISDLASGCAAAAARWARLQRTWCSAAVSRFPRAGASQWRRIACTTRIAPLATTARRWLDGTEVALLRGGAHAPLGEPPELTTRAERAGLAAPLGASPNERACQRCLPPKNRREITSSSCNGSILKTEGKETRQWTKRG